MNGLMTAAATVCASALICSLFSSLMPNGGTKKTVGIVIGVFMVCCLIIPIKTAFSQIDIEKEIIQFSEQKISTADQAYAKAVISETKKSLEKTLEDILLQNGVKINSCAIILAESSNNGIIIQDICIYINEEYLAGSDTIATLTRENFSVSPSIIVGSQ